MSFESETLKIALDKLLNGKYFSISDLDKIGDTVGVNTHHCPDHKWLRLLHCVDYSSMTPEIRLQIPQKVMNCLDPSARVNTGILAKALLIEGHDHINIEDHTLRIN